MATFSGGWDLESQKTEIRDLLKSPLKKGDKWYLLDTKWFKQWKKYVGYESWDACNVGQQEARPGPIDNLPLIVGESLKVKTIPSPKLPTGWEKRFDRQTRRHYYVNHNIGSTQWGPPQTIIKLQDCSGKLKEHLIEEIDYQLVPLNAWNKLEAWYGLVNDQIPIERFVIEQGMFVKHCKVEVYKLELKMCQRNFQSENIITTMSRADLISDILDSIREVFGVPIDVDIKLYHNHKLFTNMKSTLQDEPLYSGQVIAFEAYKDGHLVQTPYNPVRLYFALYSKEINREVLKRKMEVTKSDAASNTGTDTQTQLRTDGDEKVPNQKKKVTKSDAASNTGETTQSQMRNDGKSLFSKYCEPCFRGNKESITFSWCSDCEETLCSACDEAHKISKVSMSHTAVAVANISSTIPITVTSYVLCEAHPDKNMEFYCSEHSILCCRACIPTIHRTCDIVSIEDVSKKAKQSALFEKLSIDVKELFDATECLKERHSNNLEEIIQQELTITSKIKQLKAVFDNHFEKLESKLETEIKQLKQKVVSEVTQNENAIDKLYISLKKHKADFQFVTDHGSNKQAFMLANILKPEIEKKESELNELIALERKMGVEFETNVDNVYLENAIKSLGTIKISETSIEYKNIRPSIAQSMKSKEKKLA